MSDLISRQAAIDMFQNLAYDDWNQGVSTSWADAYRECAEMIRELPSAQPERKVGRWKYETMKHIITGEMRTVRICSECDGGWFRYDMSDGVEDAEPNYCPNCGARMREDGEKE